MKKKVIVLGASESPSRYSNRAIHKLIERGFDPIPIGLKGGNILGIKIQSEWPKQKIYAITIYLNAKNQFEYYTNILTSNATKVVFNPGSENEELLDRCRDRKLEVVEACSLVLLTLGEF